MIAAVTKYLKTAASLTSHLKMESTAVQETDLPSRHPPRGHHCSAGDRKTDTGSSRGAVLTLSRELSREPRARRAPPDAPPGTSRTEKVYTVKPRYKDTEIVPNY